MTAARQSDLDRLVRFDQQIERTRSQLNELRDIAAANQGRAVGVREALPQHQDELAALIAQFQEPVDQLQHCRANLKQDRQQSRRRVRSSWWSLQFVQSMSSLRRFRKRLIRELSWRTHWRRFQAIRSRWREKFPE